MPTISPTSDQEPLQKKLINPYLMKHIFTNQLSDLEQSLLADGTGSLSKEQFQSMTAKEQERLYLCYLLTSRTIEISETLDAKALVRLAALAERFELIADMRDEGKISPEQLIHILKSKEVLESAAATNDPNIFNQLLNFSVNSNLSLKDYLLTADFQTIYYRACLNGQLNIVKHLESLPGFNATEAASAYDYRAYREACRNEHLDIVKHLESLPGFNATEAAGAYYYAAYREACANGQLKIVEHISSLSDFKAIEAARAYSYRAYWEACGNGHLNIVKHLESLPDFKAIKAASAYGYQAYLAACRNGHFDIVKHLESLPDFEAIEAASANDYQAYREACGNGQLDIVKHLESLPGFEAKKVASANDYEAYREACANGQLNIIEHISSLSDFKAIEAARAYSYRAYREACRNGQLDIVKHLESLPGFEAKKAASANDYEAYREACGNGHLNIVKHLESLPDFEAIEAASANDYEPYLAACRNGHFGIVKHLESLPDFEAIEAASANDYWPYLAACRNGYLDIVKHLSSLLGDEATEAVSADDYEAYREACANGHFDIVKHLESLPGFEVIEAASTDDYQAYREACANGQLDIVKHLSSLLGDEAIEAASVNNYEAYRSACGNGHSNIAAHLLNIDQVFAYAESHDSEYGKDYIYSWVALKLKQLNNDKTAFIRDNPHGVFDVTPEQARYYLILLRNLIRRGVEREHASAENLTDEIIALLEIPAVKSRCHQSLSNSGQENELLRLAMSIGNSPAAAQLLVIPEVRSLAEENNYYQDERRNGVDLRRLARDRESSMTALTEGEQRRLQRLQSHYKGLDVNSAFDDFKQKLASKYEENPAIITNDAEQTIALPLEWDNFSQLTLSEAEKKKALTAYYKNDVHTVIRYLAKPNKWMAADAPYVYGIPEAGTGYSSFEEYKPLISLLYTAAFDESTEGTEGFTVETRAENFIKELALLARAHNWDKTRVYTREDGTISREEFDDLEGDKPSCFSGVKRRLFQSVLGHPFYDILTKEHLHEELRNFIRVYWESLLMKNKALVAESYNKIIDGDNLEDSDWENLQLADITKEKQTEFFELMTKKYGEQFSLDLSLQKGIAKIFKYKQEKDAHILNLGHFQPEQIFTRSEPTPSISGTMPKWDRLCPQQSALTGSPLTLFSSQTREEPTGPQQQVESAGLKPQ